jgi:DNA-binding transcriptional regulator YiaG
MSNVAKVLRAEISRISRREMKNSIEGIRKSNRGLKKIVADLKRRVLLLEKGNKGLVAAMRRYQVESLKTHDQEETAKARFTSKGIRSLRSRLRLTQADFARLLGTTPYSVYLWETKEGALKLRDKTREALLSVRGLRAREARMKLVETVGKVKKGTKVRPKKRKRS